MLVDGRRGRLNDENLPFAHRLIETNGRFAVGESLNSARAEFDAKLARDLNGQLAVGSSCEDDKIILHKRERQRTSDATSVIRLDWKRTSLAKYLSEASSVLVLKLSKRERSKLYQTV